MNTDLLSFLVIYNLERTHTSLMREIGNKGGGGGGGGGAGQGIQIKTPFQAVEYWYKLTPQNFRETPLDFKEKLLTIRANL